MPRGASEQRTGRSAMGCPHTWMRALSAHRHSGTDPRNSQRSRRVALACEVVSEDHITPSKTARRAIADPDFHLPIENKNVLSPGCGVPIAPMVRRETAEHEVGARLKCNVVAFLGRQREIFKMGLAVVARIYPYVHVRAPAHREIIVRAKEYSASSPMTKLLASCSARCHRNVCRKHEDYCRPAPTRTGAGVLSG